MHCIHGGAHWLHSIKRIFLRVPNQITERKSNVLVIAKAEHLNATQKKKCSFIQLYTFFIIKSVYLIFTLFRRRFGKKADRSCDERLDHPYERLYNIQKKNQWSRLCVHVQGERVGLLHLQVTKQCYDAHLLSHHFTYVFDKFNRLSISHWSVVIIIFSGWIINFN